MNWDLGWIAWFFYGSAPVWGGVLVCVLAMVLFFYLDRIKLLIGASILTISLIILGTCGGLYNVNRMDRCKFCGEPLPPEYAYSYCAKHLDMQ